MKKLIFAITIVAAACSPVAIAQPTSSPTPTETPFIVPSLPPGTAQPTPTPIVISPMPVPEKELFYTVKEGDTLTAISATTGVTVADLTKFNNLADPNWIWAGQQLLLVSREELLSRAFAEKGRKVIVMLSTQWAYAVEDQTVVKSFRVSTGLPASPTVIGRFEVFNKLRYEHMVGPGYNLPNVPYTMYFYQGYSLHGTYWHHNWGHPMSHGCVNMQTIDAEWLYNNWVDIGTAVWVIP